MLFVKTYLDNSPIHGIGLFANEFIPKGTIIWKFMPGFDRLLKEKRVSKLPQCTRNWLARYSYPVTTHFLVCMDDARFFNHSDEPNTIDVGKKITIAKKDIHLGEELTCDYFALDPHAKAKLEKGRKEMEQRNAQQRERKGEEINV